MIPVLLIIFILLQVYDYYSTKYTILKLKGTEVNPLMRWVINNLGFPGLVVIKSILSLGVVAIFTYYPHPWLLAIACIFQLGINISNTIQIRKVIG